MTQFTYGMAETFLLSQNKDSGQTRQSLPLRNRGIGTTLFSESNWDSTEREKDPYLHSQEVGKRKNLNFGEKMQFVILQNSINDLYSKEPGVRKEAEEWFASKEKQYVFSFECCCLTFNFNPDAVRKALVEKRWDHDVYKFRINGRR